jgi:hypothetical protein
MNLFYMYKLYEIFDDIKKSAAGCTFTLDTIVYYYTQKVELPRMDLLYK